MLAARKTTPTKGWAWNASTTDALTGLWNRAGFISAAGPLVASSRGKSPMTLAYFDFHTNDASAWQRLGSRTLTTMADLMRRTFGERDIIARIANRRFAVLLGDSASWMPATAEGVHALTDEATQRPLSVAVASVRHDKSTTLADLMHSAEARIDEIIGRARS